jgi:hypothetical protein
MLSMGCPVGVILTPAVFRIYKDRFVGRTEDSIELVGDFASGELFPGGRPGALEKELEFALVEWLDELAQSGQVKVNDRQLESAIAEHILPAVSGGEVSVAHPDAP